MQQIFTFNSFRVLIALTLAITGCKKEAPYMSNAEITGFDYKMCLCCGGIEITIDNAPNPNGNTYFLIDQLPTNFTLGNNPKFPIAVTVDWKIDTAHCFGNYVDITRIARR